MQPFSEREKTGRVTSIFLTMIAHLNHPETLKICISEHPDLTLRKFSIRLGLLVGNQFQLQKLTIVILIHS